MRRNSQVAVGPSTFNQKSSTYCDLGSKPIGSTTSSCQGTTIIIPSASISSSWSSDMVTSRCFGRARLQGEVGSMSDTVSSRAEHDIGADPRLGERPEPLGWSARLRVPAGDDVLHERRARRL